MPRFCDPKLKMGKNYSYLFNLKGNILYSCKGGKIHKNAKTMVRKYLFRYRAAAEEVDVGINEMYCSMTKPYLVCII